MIALVRIALSRPYTFVVLALLLLIIGPLAALRTPTDIFPDIRIPVIGVVWQYTGLPPDQMAGRITTPFQRALTTTVNDIEHIVANSYNGFGIVKIFFQPNVDIRTANAQVTAISQTLIKQMPPGATPPLILNYSASTVPIIQVALSGEGLTEQNLADIGINQLRTPLVTVPGAAIPYPFGGKQRQVQIDLNPTALQSRGLSGQDVANALAAQNLITPVGTQKIGGFEYTIQLNNSPLKMEELGNLPIRTVNGAMVYVRDVASVRDGNPPQTNIVHVDGHRSVLMMVLKAGSISTLDIIAGIKQKVIDVKDSLPDALKIGFIGDQSLFVRGAITGVAFEGVIAALLTSVMILLFLGSWRSTIIIAVSIPLSVLGAIVMLSAIGETLNIMTLGGLALAVGILVDDATVTIENINWHLEQGKDVETSIMDGANQIVTPAFVSLLCICIVFVPMFFLEGVARFLFVPMAEAVMFAMIWSFLLSRTLVPTMAKYLLLPHVQHAEGESPPPTRNPLVRFQRAFEAGFERVRGGYRDLLTLAMGRRPVFVIGFLGFVGLSFLLVPYLGRNFFPSVDAGSILMHVRTQVGTRVEESANQLADVQKAIRKIIPPSEIETLADNIGMPISGINMTYNNTGVIGPADGDIQIKLKEGHRPTDEYVQALREQLPRAFPGMTFAFLPADIVSQILNFGAPAPIDLQIRGADMAANFAYANQLLSRIRRIPGIADARIQQSPNSPGFNIDVDRTRAQLCRTDRARRHQQPGRQSRRQFAGRADLLSQPGQWRVLFDRDADAAIPDGLAERAGDIADYRRDDRRAADPRRHRQHLAIDFQRGSLAIRHCVDGADLCDAARPRSRRRRRRHQDRDRRYRQGCAEGLNGGAARPGADHEQRVLRAAVWTAGRGGPDLPLDRGELPVLVRSVRDHIGAAGSPRRHHLDAVHDPDHAVGAGADRRHHVHGRRHRQQRAGDQLCPRALRRAGRPDCGGARSRLRALPPSADDGAGDDHRHDTDGARPRRGRRAERAARTRRDRRPDLRDHGDVDVCSRGF
jgi:multidrug efflux pump subunit AcrB